MIKAVHWVTVIISGELVQSFLTNGLQSIYLVKEGLPAEANLVGLSYKTSPPTIYLGFEHASFPETLFDDNAPYVWFDEWCLPQLKPIFEKCSPPASSHD